jgi:hypothetical protein
MISFTGQHTTRLTAFGAYPLVGDAKRRDLPLWGSLVCSGRGLRNCSSALDKWSTASRCMPGSWQLFQGATQNRVSHSSSWVPSMGTYVFVDESSHCGVSGAHTIKGDPRAGGGANVIAFNVTPSICRFDIMGHIMVATMQRARAALNKLTLEEHGVDGASIYLYGEAWDFGEVSCNQRGQNASQLNIGGTGLGTQLPFCCDSLRAYFSAA